MRGVCVYTAFSDSGYGLAGAAYVRALLHAGVPVQWTIFDWPIDNKSPVQLLNSVDTLQRLARWHNEPCGRDLAALVKATARPIAFDTTFIHAPPEHYARLAVQGCRNVGYTAWETTRIPAHWNSLLHEMDAVMVPSQMNREAFAQSGVRTPLYVIPHIARSFWNEFSEQERSETYRSHGLDQNRLTLLTIGTCQPRRNLEQLIRAFCAAFTATSPVQLLVKSSHFTETQAIPYARIPTDAQIQSWLRECGGDQPNAPLIRWVARDDLTPRQLDAFHNIADCYVSFSHGEGWGLGAFDAAANGVPVVMPAWGGHRDYLADPWPGAIGCTLSAAPVWPMSKPSFWPDQRWATMRDIDCVEALQRSCQSLDALREHARQNQALIANEFSELRVAKRLIAALEGPAK